MANTKIDLDQQMLLFSLEDSLSTMREAIVSIYDGDASKVKIVSGILRDLVCFSSGNRGLLWRTKEKIPYDDVINVPDFQANFARDPRSKESFFFAGLMDHGIWQLNGPILKKISLQKYLQEETAVRIKLASSTDAVLLTPEKVIKEVADQIGAHTDKGVSETFATLVSVKSGQSSILVRLITSFSILVAEVGERVLDTALSLGYKRRKPTIKLPEKSVAHIKVNYDLMVPELDMEDVRHISYYVSYRSAKEALAGPLPFTIERTGKKNMFVDNWVGLPLTMNFEIHINDVFQGNAGFPYPKDGDSSKMVDICWNDEKIRVEFNNSIKILSRKI